MVHFKVFKGSHILLGAAIIILAAVLLLIILSLNPSAEQEAAGTPVYNEATMACNAEAGAVSALASGFISEESLQVEISVDPVPSPLPQKACRILIYHTHTHEAYAQDQENPYDAIEAWRTADQSHSVVRVGSKLAELLRERGYYVIHDTTDHELDSLDDSYIRSLDTLEARSGEFDISIDLHRDAYIEGQTDCLRTDDGGSFAQIMLLVGRGDAYAPQDRPDYEANLHFAQQLTGELNRILPGIGRNVTVKTGRYNQHLGKPGLLVEVGHNRNSLDQAIASMPCLADALDATIQTVFLKGD